MSVHKIRHMKMSSYFPAKSNKGELGQDQHKTEPIDEALAHEQLLQSKLLSAAPDAGGPAVVRLKLAKLKKLGE